MNNYFVYSCGDFYVAFVKINGWAMYMGKSPEIGDSYQIKKSVFCPPNLPGSKQQTHRGLAFAYN